MIALLIGSLILGFTAPVISKQIKYNNYNDVQAKIFENELRRNLIPSGAVMAFNLAECPPNWDPLNTVISGTDGAFIRNIGGNAKSIGEVQEDAAPNITGFHGGHGSYHGWGTAGGSFILTTISNARTSSDKSGTPQHQVNFDASESSESYGRDDTTEVRPKNIALLYCVKR